jgi:mRNA interferase YafQ
LEARHREHALAGEWIGWRDCHVAPDWVLIYRTTETELILGRTGTHSDLFG